MALKTKDIKAPGEGGLSKTLRPGNEKCKLNGITLEESIKKLKDIANEIYKMQPEKDLKQKLSEADWAAAAVPPAKEDVIDVEEIPF